VSNHGIRPFHGVFALLLADLGSLLILFVIAIADILFVIETNVRHKVQVKVS